MPLSKTLGQVAREAYENAIEAHDPDEIHARFPRDSFWQAAAEAVARATVAEVRTQMSDMHREATPITVYVVKITTKTLHPTVTIGAVYTDEQHAIEEVASLNQKNSYTRASYVARQLEATRAHRRLGMHEPDPEWTCDLCGQTFDEGPCPA